VQSASARIRNVFGGAETFEANMSLGTKTRRAFRATLVAPLTPQMNAFGEIGAYGLEKDLTSYASCTEGLRGVRAVIRVSPSALG
jgi:outer membrane protein insertion porin family